MKKIPALLLALIASVSHAEVQPSQDASGRWGVKSDLGKVLIPFQYDALQRISNMGSEPTFVATLKGKQGYVDSVSGDVLIKPLYDKLYVDPVLTDEQGRGVAFALKGEKWGVLDTDGDVLVDFELDEVRQVLWDHALVRRGDSVLKLRFEGDEFKGEELVCKGCGGFSNENTWKAVGQRQDAKFAGIGVAINRIEERKSGPVDVLDVLREGPAAQAGLQPRDQITHVAGQAVDAMPVEAVSNLLRGPVDTPVTMTVIRQGQTLEITAKRAQINLR